MRITELNITEFGCLKDRKLTPSGKFNIIYGENESGKSTVLLFIKFMLYGMTRRSSSNSERERSVSWSGHRAAGSMTFEHNEKLYRVERSFTETTRSGSEKLTVTCLDDGEQITTDKSVGEYFLGVPREVFEGSAYVGQMRSADVNGDKIAASIENMLSAADESVDTAKVIKNLDAVRVSYLHKNGNGGSLYESKQKINSLAQRVSKAEECAVSLAEMEQKLEIAKRDYGIAKKDYDTADALLAELNKVSIIKRFDNLHKEVEKKEKISSERKKLEEEMKTGDFFPTKEHCAELKISAKAYGQAKSKYEELDGALKNRKEIDFDEEQLKIGKSMDGPSAVADVISRLKNIRMNVALSKKVITVAVIIAVLGLAVGVLLSVLLNIPVGAVTSAAFLLFSAIIAAKKLKDGKKESEKLKKMAEQFNCKEDEIEEKLQRCLNTFAEYKNGEAEKARMTAEVLRAEEEFEETRQRLLALLKLTRNVEDVNQVSVEAAENERIRLNALIEEREKLLGYEEAQRKLIEAAKAELEHYDEEELRKSLSVDPDQITYRTLSEVQTQRDFHKNRVNALSARISGFETAIMSNRVSAEDPLPIADELAELEKKYRADGEFYNALTLAIESIEQASASMRGNVTPQISKQAGEILSNISNGRYTALRTTNSLGVSLDKDGYGIKSEYLSGGTRDAAYLALRLALLNRIYENGLPPLILDESTCQLDDSRTQRLLAYLAGLSESGVQVLLFTSHKREEEICKGIGVEYSKTAL